MVRQITTITFTVGSLLYLFFLPTVFESEKQILFLNNYFALLVFCAVIHYVGRQKESFFKPANVGLITFVYVLLFVFIDLLISYYYRGNYYVFSESDAVMYNEESVKMANMPVVSSVEYYLKFHEAEDLGIVMIMSTIYRLIESKLLFNFSNVVIGTITAIYLFKMSANFMNIKNAFLCALTYSISSYVIWFHASGLKESFMVFLIVGFYYKFYEFKKNKKNISLISSILFLSSILFFRPPVVFIILISLAIGEVLSRKLNLRTGIILLLIIIVIALYISNINALIDKFTHGGTNEMLEKKEIEGMIKDSVMFTYFTNIFASLFGPLPTILINKTIISFYSSGLIFKSFLSITFILGSFYSFKFKNKLLYPMIIFILIEIVLLNYILESLELRKSLTHFPFIYIVGFWFINFYERNQANAKTEKIKIKKVFTLYIFIISLLIIYWNFRL